MIGTRGLDKKFDRLIDTDVAARYVVEHPNMSRSTRVPRRYLGKNPDGSTRNHEEFRAFASMVRHWGGRIAEAEAEKRIKQEALKELQLHLIKIKATKFQAAAALSAVRIEFIRHQTAKKKSSVWPFGRLAEFQNLFREVVTAQDGGLALV